MAVLQLDEYKARQRAAWQSGDYSACSPYIAEVGELVVARAGITPGMRVLDVACGNGNAALPAARAGGRVTGLALVARLLEAARFNARAERGHRWAIVAPAGIPALDRAAQAGT